MRSINILNGHEILSSSRRRRRCSLSFPSLIPYKPNADSLASEIGISRNSVQDYLALLERAQLIGQLRDDTGGMRGLGKVEKVYIDNHSLMNALSGGKTDVGNMRETFFYNQMRVRNDVKDDIEFAQGNVIPLWAFGLNY